jgi:hypothetical protein
MTEPVRRVHYFSGQFLSPEDLQAEQDYHRQMRYLHNRLLGQGVVQGLEVTVGDGSTVSVSPGVAIDGCGRELVIPDAVAVDVSGSTDGDGARDLTATWAEEPDSFVVSVADGDGDAAFSRWIERPRVALVPPGEAAEDSLVLGRVLFSAGEVAAVDVSGRSIWRRFDPVDA